MNEPVRPRPGVWTGPLKYTPDPAEVGALIESAGGHPLGVDFLLGGELGSVAATFHTHAFTVLAARERLAKSES
jgi:hypothetical protein